MTHDPNEKLCQFVEMDERDYELNCAFYAPPDCQCELIAKVREDAIAAAVQRIEALPHALECVTRDVNYSRPCNCLHGDALDAIKGDQP
jgi:hypothetical protein